jgi:hypothetical protein
LRSIHDKSGVLQRIVDGIETGRDAPRGLGPLCGIPPGGILSAENRPANTPNQTWISRVFAGMAKPSGTSFRMSLGAGAGQRLQALKPERTNLMKSISIVMTTVLGLAALPAFAQDAPEIADTDGNGTWSMDELLVAYPDMTAETFTAVDANADGAVDQAELAAALADGALPAGG